MQEVSFTPAGPEQPSYRAKSNDGSRNRRRTSGRRVQPPRFHNRFVVARAGGGADAQTIRDDMPSPLPATYDAFLKEIEAKYPNIGNVAQWSTKNLWLPRNLDHWDCLVISDEVRRQISVPLERTKFIERVGDFSVLRNDE